jgi:hypothetical protein
VIETHGMEYCESSILSVPRNKSLDAGLNKFPLSETYLQEHMFCHPSPIYNLLIKVELYIIIKRVCAVRFVKTMLLFNATLYLML